MTRHVTVLVIIAIVVLVLVINNDHKLSTQVSRWNRDGSFSQEKVEVDESVSASAKQNAASSFHVVYCIFKTQGGAALDYATFKAIVPTNMRIVAQNGGKSHILTNDGRAIRALLAQSRIDDDDDDDDNMAAFTIQDFPINASSVRLQKFRQSYISQTLNDASYEELCMLRWIIIADFFNNLSEERVKDRILAIDTDVLLTADPRQLLHTIQAEKLAIELESIMIINGAAMALSTKGLDNFVTFLINVYATSENTTAFVKQHGTVFPLCRPESSLLIPCVKEDNQMWHISDMHIWNAWFQEKESASLTRLHWGEQEDPPCLPIQPVWSSTKLISSLEGFHFQKQGSRIQSRVNDRNATDVCLVHFQGETKRLVPGFVSFVTGKSNQSTFSTR